MTLDDCDHIAQCCHSLIQRLDADEFDRFIDRLIWAIHASPGGTPNFNHDRFVMMCKGRTT